MPTRCHFLPHKPGVIAYAAAEIARMDIVFVSFILSYFRINDESFLTYKILPFDRIRVKVVLSCSSLNWCFIILGQGQASPLGIVYGF